MIRRSRQSIALVCMTVVAAVGNPASQSDQEALLSRPVEWGPHGRNSARMLTLAKLGPPAIPAIKDRILDILQDPDPHAYGRALPLIAVLGLLGPPALPTLVDIAAASPSPFTRHDALQEIARFDHNPLAFGQRLRPWTIWEPADGKSSELRRQIVPQLRRIERMLDEPVRQSLSDFPAPEVPAAYLLARWGAERMQERGLKVLQRIVRTSDPNSGVVMEAIWLLHALRAPDTGVLLQLIAANLDQDDRDYYEGRVLQLARALAQLGDPSYKDLLTIPLNGEQPHLRHETLKFLVLTGDFDNVPMMIDALDDVAEWDGRRVADVALESLRDLTMETLPLNAKLWREWFEKNQSVTRRSVVSRTVRTRMAATREAPIWEVNRWIDEYRAGDGPLIFQLIDVYLARQDLDPAKIGPSASVYSGGTGHVGEYGPRVVTLLLEMAQRGTAGAVQRLAACLEAADPSVRIFGALALAAYDKAAAIAQLAVEARAPSEWPHRDWASEFLLRLGDARGIPGRLEALSSDLEYRRLKACRDLRVYTQQPLPCHDEETNADSVRQTWLAWWKANQSTFQVRQREAALDLKSGLP